MALTMLLSPSMDCGLYLGHGDLQNEPPIFFQKSILSFFGIICAYLGAYFFSSYEVVSVC